MAFASVREWEHRNLSYQAGPRRQALLHHKSAEVRDSFVAEFKINAANHEKLDNITEDWATPFQRRSMFKRANVAQLKLCLVADDWMITRRLLYDHTIFMQSYTPPPKK